MPFTQTHLDALIAAYGAGESQVTFQGRTTVYRSVADLERAITFIRGELAGEAAVVIPRIRRVVIFQDDENNVPEIL